MLDRMAPEALPFVDPSFRLLQPDTSPRVAKWRFWLVLAICLVLHVVIVVFLLLRGMNDIEPQQSEEVPVELVTEVPQPPSPPPAPPPEPEQKKPEPKQEQPEYEHILKPAFDAPRAPNKETVEREAPHRETQAPEQQSQPVLEPPAERAAQPDTPKIADVPAPERQEQMSQTPPDDDKPDAEALARAELQEKQDKQKANADAAKTKKPLPVDQKAAMAKQLAALAPLPDFTLGAKSKPAIVSGGTENTTYLSVLYGLIMKKMTNLNAMRSSPGTSVIFFALDDTGHILHIAVEKASGFPDIDQQTLDAVRRAAPFPPPPRDIPHRFFFSRDVDRGR
jgi:protein TonB